LERASIEKRNSKKGLPFVESKERGKYGHEAPVAVTGKRPGGWKGENGRVRAKFPGKVY